MDPRQKPTILGRYAIHFKNLAETSPMHKKKPSAKAGPEDGIEQLRNEADKAENILIKARAIFPFDPFPDSITIDRQKLTIVRHRFLIDKETLSVQLSDIKNVQATLGPLFGSITVISQNFAKSTQSIRYLHRKDVLAIQQIIQGFIVAKEEEVDMDDIDDETLKSLLSRLGRGEAGEQPVES